MFHFKWNTSYIYSRLVSNLTLAVSLNLKIWSKISAVINLHALSALAAKYQNRRKMSSSDRALIVAFKEIYTIADRINLYTKNYCRSCKQLVQVSEKEPKLVFKQLDRTSSRGCLKNRIITELKKIFTSKSDMSTLNKKTTYGACKIYDGRRTARWFFFLFEGVGL
jgi:hypothetical protein